jgi:hypothetical protein
MTLVKYIDHSSQTIYAISEEDAYRLLPRTFVPYAVLGTSLLQVGALKYKDLILDGRSLGPCTDVYVAVGVNWHGRLHGFNLVFFNNSQMVIDVINRILHIGKKKADIIWKEYRDSYRASVIYDGIWVLDYTTTIPMRLAVLPVLPRIQRAVTLSDGNVYTFDNSFDAFFGHWAQPDIEAAKGLDWLNRLCKHSLYSATWFDDILRVSDVRSGKKIRIPIT